MAPSPEHPGGVASRRADAQHTYTMLPVGDVLPSLGPVASARARLGRTLLMGIIGAAGLIGFVAIAAPYARQASLPMADVLPAPDSAAATTCLNSMGARVRDTDENGYDEHDYTVDRYIEVYAYPDAQYTGGACNYTYRYWHVIVIAGTDPMGSACGEVHYVGNQQWMNPGYEYLPFQYDTQACAGHGGHGIADGTKSGRIYLVRCTSGQVNSNASVWNVWDWLDDRAGTCIYGAYNSYSILKDATIPTMTWPAPSENDYQNSTSFLFDWSMPVPPPSSPHWKSHRVIQRASVTNGACDTFSTHSDAGWSTSGTYNATGMISGSCWRLAIELYDRAGNLSSWSYSPWLMVDTDDPTLSFSDGMDGFTAGDETTCGAANGSGSSVDRWCLTDSGQLRSYWAQDDGLSGLGVYWIGIDEAAIASPGVCDSTWMRIETRGPNDTDPNPDAYSTWSVDPGSCYRWVITLHDEAGNSVTTNADAILVDVTDPPAISWDEPTSAQWESAAAPLTFDWTSSARRRRSTILREPGSRCTSSRTPNAKDVDPVSR